MPLINCKVVITGAKLYVHVVTLSAEDNIKLVKQLNKGFKQSVYWNRYNVIDNKVVEIAAASEEKYIRELLNLSYQGQELKDYFFFLMIIQQISDIRRIS